MNRGELDILDWRSSRSCEGGACVEVALAAEDLIAMRDSRDPDGVITFRRDEWHGFIIKVKTGAFDIA